LAFGVVISVRSDGVSPRVSPAMSSSAGFPAAWNACISSALETSKRVK
jgi:hypothetical protein